MVQLSGKVVVVILFLVILSYLIQPADCLFMDASLVAADRLYTTKRAILEELGLGGFGCVGGEELPMLRVSLHMTRLPHLIQAQGSNSPFLRIASLRSSWSFYGCRGCKIRLSLQRQGGWPGRSSYWLVAGGSSGCSTGRSTAPPKGQLLR